MIFGLFKSRATKVTLKKKGKSAGKTKKRRIKSRRPKGKPLRRPAKAKKRLRRASKMTGKKPRAEEIVIGEITHYFPHVKAGVIKVAKSGLALGDEVHIKGHTSDFRQKITSMQINNVPIKAAKKGQ